MDALQLQERIRQTIALGESQFREFKSAFEGPPNQKKPRDTRSVSKDIAEALVAFANADGGVLLVGVEDDGTITGLGFREETITKLLDVPRTGVYSETPLDSPIARRVTLGDKEILYFAVDKGVRTIHQTSDGRCLQRKDRENRPVSAVQLQFERQEQISREYDRQFVDGAMVTDLNLDIVRRVADDILGGMSPEKCLQYLGLAEYSMEVFRLRKSALLLFAADIGRWHPRCQVRVVRVRGTELKTGREYNVITDDIASGNILELVTSAWEKLRPHLVETKLTPDALFRERIMYPEDACREALINAITHRDYSIEGQNIEILIYDDRMEVQSPGGLLSTVKIDNLTKLQGIHDSRNAFIARVLREIGYVREMGEGMRRIFLLMRDADLVPPELHSEPGRFSMILQYKSVFSEIDQRWLDGFKSLSLTREEMLILLLGKDGRLISPRQIYDRLSLVDWDVYRTIIEQIQTKEAIYNAVSRQQKVTQARNKNVSQRDVPRLAVRQPEECEHALSELFVILRDMRPVSFADKSFAQSIINALSSNNPYKTNPERIIRLMKLLKLIDEDRNPTAKLTTLWGKSARIVSSDTKSNSGRLHPVTASVASAIDNRASANTTRTKKEASKNSNSHSSDIFIGNLDYDTTLEELKSLLIKYGDVVYARIPTDYTTRHGRGFAFVRMASQEQGERLVQELNGQVFRGRALRVNLDPTSR